MSSSHDIPGPIEVGGQGDLAVQLFARYHDHSTPGRLDESGIVGAVTMPSVSSAQRHGAERLWRLHRHQPIAMRRGDHHALGIDLFDRVGHRQTGHRCVCTVCDSCDHPLKQCDRGERASRIVYAHHIDVVGHLGQPATNTVAAARTTDDGPLLVRVLCWYHDDHAVACQLCNSARPVDHSFRAQRFELLQTAETGAAATSDHDGPDLRTPMHRTEGSTVADHMTEYTQLLAETMFFADATEEMLARIEASGTQRRLVRGDVLFNEGDAPDALYLVGLGRIAIAIANPIDRRESVVALMEPGDLFGELGLLDDGPRSALARALEPSDVLEVPFQPVRDLFEEHPQLLWNVARLLAGRLRVMDSVLSDSVFLDVTGRTAKRLLEMAGDADEFQLPVTQEELSGMVGASRERVNKSIANFIKLGWLEQHDRNYRIIQRDRLELRAR